MSLSLHIELRFFSKDSAVEFLGAFIGIQKDLKTQCSVSYRVLDITIGNTHIVDIHPESPYEETMMLLWIKGIITQFYFTKRDLEVRIIYE